MRRPVIAGNLEDVQDAGGGGARILLRLAPACGGLDALRPHLATLRFISSNRLGRSKLASRDRDFYRWRLRMTLCSRGVGWISGRSDPDHTLCCAAMLVDADAVSYSLLIRKYVTAVPRRDERRLQEVSALLQRV